MSGSAKVEMSSLLIDYLLILGGQDGRRGQGLNERQGVKAVACDPSSDREGDDANRGERAFGAFGSADSTDREASAGDGGWGDRSSHSYPEIYFVPSELPGRYDISSNWSMGRAVEWREAGAEGRGKNGCKVGKEETDRFIDVERVRTRR